MESESEWSHGGSSSDCNFSFAFNDPKFSDRVLRIEIMTDPVDAPPSSDSVTTIADCEQHCKRRRRENYISGDEAGNSNGSNRTMDCSVDTIVRVKTLHISSPILAAKSPFFYKLFSNGMRESQQIDVTLRINASEEAALMDLLNFMYSNTLNITAAPALLDVLMAADKFGVSSCMRYCIRLLPNLPMTPDSALLYQELLHTVYVAQPLADAVEQYLAGQFKDITKFQEEVLALVMESEGSHCGSSFDCDFGFAFNDINFSNKVLRIEIISDLVDAPPNSDNVTTTDDWARHCKRRRTNGLDFTSLPDEQILNGNQPDIGDGVPYENQDEESFVMVEKFPPGVEGANINDSKWNMDSSAAAVVRVKTLHISSPILAAKSPFFYKLFVNGTEHRHVTLRINASEEIAFMELLNFMYKNTLNIIAAPALRDVLMAADKFEVSSCMRFCIQLPMTPDFALLYLELLHTGLMSDSVQPLADAAKEYLVGRYKDITKFQEEVMTFPLYGIEAILASDDLQVKSEDDVYNFVLKWARQHYNKRKERQEVLGTRLSHLIRFPFMTCQKLGKALTCIDFKHKEASKLVHKALFFKADAPYHERSWVAEWSASLNHCCFVERAYKWRPVRIVEFELPRQQCVVYLDLKREECATLFPSCGYVSSQTFHFGGQEFFLSAKCKIMDQQSPFYCFGLFLGMRKYSSVSFDVDYEFAVRSRPTEEFVSKFKDKCTFTDATSVFGPVNLFAIPWTSFMAEESLFFINGVLHLRAELTIRH
ncbi:BTB/POZ domain-containing protein At2g46260-like [Lotus japonicus]|uniref:BTB/POZ domain-containing protein At2g46260-like n=1 Tax=Lotus japonicus TaxID=34305 RepID=UPI00258EEBBB|nr:BTB/POZ domain-containing protein At2g46260-like [Lotus japonicus]